MITQLFLSCEKCESFCFFVKWRTFICNIQERNEYFISKSLLPALSKRFIGSVWDERSQINENAPAGLCICLYNVQHAWYLMTGTFFLVHSVGNSPLQSLSRLASWHLLQYQLDSNKWHSIDSSPFQLVDRNISVCCLRHQNKQEVGR